MLRPVELVVRVLVETETNSRLGYSFPPVCCSVVWILHIFPIVLSSSCTIISCCTALVNFRLVLVLVIVHALASYIMSVCNLWNRILHVIYVLNRNITKNRLGDE